jgi:membrane protein
VIENAQDRPDIGSLAGWWSILLLFIGATAVFARLQATLNRIFSTDASQLGGGFMVWLRKRFFSFSPCSTTTCRTAGSSWCFSPVPWSPP